RPRACSVFRQPCTRWSWRTLRCVASRCVLRRCERSVDRQLSLEYRGRLAEEPQCARGWKIRSDHNSEPGGTRRRPCGHVRSTCVFRSIGNTIARQLPEQVERLEEQGLHRTVPRACG